MNVIKAHTFNNRLPLRESFVFLNQKTMSLPITAANASTFKIPSPLAILDYG